jgi:hypothetical protein
MTAMQRKDGFLGEKQINVPEEILERFTRNMPFQSSLYITHIGFFPKAQFHFREREKGCDDFILIYCLEGKRLLFHRYGKLSINRQPVFHFTSTPVS